MSLHSDLLAQARHLATKEPKRPRQASLRRAVSTAYYAVFHMLIDEAARRMISGGGRTALRHCLARAYAHGNMKKVAKQFADGGVSPKLSPGLNSQPLQPELVAVAETFVDLQQARHEADYDIVRRFNRNEVLDLADRAQAAMADWRQIRKSAQADTFLIGLLAFESMRG
ncbi:MAG: hypothetical protein OXF89_19440 [Rhodospirillaceae bacterium]|nr:hypothetical protein [Rhodospirillaceae bacterium]